jgi:hypothetical protein
MKKKTLAGMIFCVGAGSVASASNDVDLQALELLKENRISYQEYSKLAGFKPMAKGNWSNMSISDGNWSNMSLSDGNWSNMSVSDGNWSNMSISDSNWSNMSLSGDISDPDKDKGQVPQPIISKGIDD